jgi:hypothetical protein
MSTIGYTVVGIGTQDLVLGPEHYDELMGERPFAGISSNLIRASDGRSWKDPYRLVEVGERTLAVLSVTGFDPTLLENLPDGDHLVVRPPIEALQAHVPAVRERVDLVVLLAAMPLDEARLVARVVPGIDLVLGASDGTLTGANPVFEGETAIVYAGKEGQDLAEVRVHFREGHRADTSLFMHRLDRAYAEDPEVAARVKKVLGGINDYHRKQAEVRRAEGAAGSREVVAGQAAFLGVEACETCHPVAVETWWTSTHAAAFDTLVKNDADFNPKCVGCHVVAFETPGGFVDALTTPERKDVQCEACHGAGAPHLEDPRVPYGKVRISTCTVCHDTEHSPDFNFYTFLDKIRHGTD